MNRRAFCARKSPPAKPVAASAWVLAGVNWHGARRPGGEVIPVAGGVLIRNASGQLLGAIGLSGDTSDNDERCALLAIAAAGLQADSGDPQAN
jgi:uncharacterized protein GlcG (DUF336 family)